jgi:hypothetical protein
MAEPTGQDLHIDALLSNMSVAYMNEKSSYIADRVFPVVLSDKQSDLYAQYEKYAWFSDEAKERAPLTESAGGGFQMDDPGTFYCKEAAFHKDYSDDDVDTEFVTEKLRIRREVKWATAYFTAGVWGTDLSGQTDTPGTNEFLCWDESGATPISDVADAKLIVRAATGLLPNTLVVSEKVHMAICNVADILDRFKYTQAGIITEELLARVFEIDNYYVGKAIVSASPEGTNTMSYIVGQYDALLVYSAPRPSRRRPSGGYTFRWKRPTWGGNSGEKLESTIRKWYMQNIRGTRIEGSVYEDIKLVSSSCGIFFDDAIADGRTIIS